MRRTRVYYLAGSGPHVSSEPQQDLSSSPAAMFPTTSSFLERELLVRLLLLLTPDSLLSFNQYGNMFPGGEDNSTNVIKGYPGMVIYLGEPEITAWGSGDESCSR